MATPAEALAGDDIMVEATRLTEPEVLLETGWVTPGTTVIPGRLGRHNLHAELGQIVAGDLPGRERPGERILFWHRGLATTDLAVAQLVLRRAADAGLGTVLRYR